MNERHTTDLSFTIPVVMTLLLMREASGTLQSVLVGVAVIATTLLVWLVARFVWEPLLRKMGFWRSSFVLGIALAGASLAAGAAAPSATGHGFVWRLVSVSILTGLLFSWALAALRGAREPDCPNLQA